LAESGRRTFGFEYVVGKDGFEVNAAVGFLSNPATFTSNWPHCNAIDRSRMIFEDIEIVLEEVVLEPTKKKSNFRTVLVMTLIFIFVLGVLAYVSGVVINLSALANAPEATIILLSSLVGLSFAAVVALVRLSKEDR
jgi:uncharacterized integral membrane protein